MDEPMIPSSEPQPRKRVSRLFGQIIVKNRFQFKYTFMIFSFLLVAGIITYIMSYFSIRHVVRLGVIQNDQAMQAVSLINSLVLQITLLAFGVTFGLSIFFSHFIAGPIYRFERVLEQMRDGNLNLFVRLRKNDEFKETAELFNQALSSLRNRFQKERDSIQSTADKIKQSADRIRGLGRHEEADELEKLVLEIKSLPPQLKI